MQKVVLIRIREVGDVIYGVLEVGGLPRFVTLEPSWKNNSQNISCIPTGTYLCNQFDSPKYGLTFKLVDVPGRDDVEFHWGNYRKDTRGCILVGSSFSPDINVTGILKSKIAFKKFMDLLKDEKQFELVVTEAPWDL